MISVMLKWNEDASLSPKEQKIRDLFPLGIPAVKMDDGYILDGSRVTPDIMATCRSIAYGKWLDDQSMMEKLLNAPLVVARESWLNSVGLIPLRIPDKDETKQLNLF